MIESFDQSSLLEGFSIRSLNMHDPKFLEVCSQKSWQRTITVITHIISYCSRCVSCMQYGHAASTGLLELTVKGCFRQGPTGCPERLSSLVSDMGRMPHASFSSSIVPPTPKKKQTTHTSHFKSSVLQQQKQNSGCAELFENKALALLNLRSQGYKLQQGCDIFSPALLRSYKMEQSEKQIYFLHFSASSHKEPSPLCCWKLLFSAHWKKASRTAEKKLMLL